MNSRHSRKLLLPNALIHTSLPTSEQSQDHPGTSPVIPCNVCVCSVSCDLWVINTIRQRLVTKDHVANSSQDTNKAVFTSFTLIL